MGHYSKKNRHLILLIFGFSFMIMLIASAILVFLVYWVLSLIYR